MAGEAQAPPSLSPTATRVAGLEPAHVSIVTRMAAWNGTGDSPVSIGDVRTLATHLASQNLKDIFDTNAGLALRLPAKVQELEDDIEDLNATIQGQERDIKRLQRALDTAQLLVNTDAAPAPRARPQQIAEPEVFKGDRAAYLTFRSKMRNKLAGDGTSFRDDQHKMQYIVSRLDGNAYRMIGPYMREADRIDLADVQELWDVLDTAYDDPDRMGTAERELGNLKQGGREFSAYYADFQRLMAELDWNTGPKKNALYTGMSEELKDTIYHHDLPEDWPGYVKAVQKYDSKLRKRLAEKKGARIGPAPTGKPATPKVAPLPASQRTTTNAEYHGPAPMDLSAAEREAERQRRYAERRAAGLCTYCGNAGHFRSSCPKRTRQTPIRAAEGQVTPAASDATPATPTTESEN
jgi:hypothetical protein